jgi:rfaE bifunctional protein nucleotidyltransferase chain/domain
VTGDRAATSAEPAFAAKIAMRSALAARLGGLPRPRVFTNGVFDILHRGHVTYLAQARALGASLIVGVNTDASVRRLGKGGERPINALEDRLAVLAALESVSLVVPFEEDTPLALVLECRPDVIVKGGDYTAATTVGAAEVIAWGGRFAAIPFVPGRSTSALVEKIRR